MRNNLHISRIRLINFHNFVDEILPVKKNLFLIGQNRSGKTTVIDAIHFALTAGVDMEFNASARFGPKTDSGRNLSSIILRYDLENDRLLRESCIGYSVIEVIEPSGKRHCFGVGAYATSLDSQPDVWGFIAKDKSLEEITILATDKNEENKSCQRPKDKQELEECLGRGNVLDKGRYRTALSNFLVRDRDAYERFMELISVTKSYREMIARSRSLDDLFLNLLPPPSASGFQEVQSALHAINGIKADLADLDTEIGVLRFVIQKLNEAKHETEKIARYEFIECDLKRRELDELKHSTELDFMQANKDIAILGNKVKEAEHAMKIEEQTLITLNASKGAELLAREKEIGIELENAKTRNAETENDLKLENKKIKEAQKKKTQTEASFKLIKNKALDRIREIKLKGVPLLDALDPINIEHLTQSIEKLEPKKIRDEKDLKASWQIMHRTLEAIKLDASSEYIHKIDMAKRSRQDQQALVSMANEIEKRAEILPNIQGYSELLMNLAKETPDAVPLYRLLEIRKEIENQVGSLLETWLGPRVLGAIVAPLEQESVARLLVLSHGEGVEVLQSKEIFKTNSKSQQDTLPSLLSTVTSQDISLMAMSYIDNIASNVRILNPNEPRGNFEQVIWLNGNMYDRGAESRVEPNPPKFLGADARFNAAKQESDRLRNEALDKGKNADISERDAKSAKKMTDACSVYIEAINEAPPEIIFSHLQSLEMITDTILEIESQITTCESRVNGTKDEVSIKQIQYSEIQAAISKGGYKDFHKKIKDHEDKLKTAMAYHTNIRDLLIKSKVEIEQKEKNLKNLQNDFSLAKTEAESKRDVLLLFLDKKNKGDVYDYVFRIMRGNQVLASNVRNLIQDAHNARARAFEALNSSDGLKNEQLWQKYAFKLKEEFREIRDQAGHPIEEVFENREKQVRELQTALDSKTRDLLERVVMAGLVRKLQGQIRELQDTIHGVNKLASDLQFGESRFQFSLRQKSKYKRLLSLLSEESILQPASREELKDFFSARLDELNRTSAGDIPEVLDYRRWFDFTLEVNSQKKGQFAELSHQRLRFGSTGEQAVPIHLLVIAIASLLFDRVEAKLRLLLLDEAFLGIDAVRRESLLQFSDRIGVDLFVATPELDGVTPALAASSTLLIEKTPSLDVFVSDYQWERGPQQIQLDSSNQPKVGKYVIDPTGKPRKSSSDSKGDEK